MTRLSHFALISLAISIASCVTESTNLLDLRVETEPGIVTVNGRPTTYYEVHLINRSPDSIAVTMFRVVNARDNSIALSFEGDDLNNRFAPNKSGGSKKDLVIPAKESGVIYIEVTLDDFPTLTEVSHRVTFTTWNDPRRELVASGGQTRFSNKPTVVLGPPLGEGAWAAVYEPSWPRGHRRVVFTQDGDNHIPGRFAIDFIKLDDQGRYAEGTEDSIRNWFGYGSEVLAVADGTILATRDDFIESMTLSAHPKYTAEQATGNYVSMDIGNGQFAFYEHLKPSSIKVKPGQAVHKGDVIASLGFTGQSTGPHLHFHVADANSPLGAEGIPFAFERFMVLGDYEDFGDFGKKPWRPMHDLSTWSKERPAPNVVIRF